MHRRALIAAGLLCALPLSGCITHRDKNPHNDVLIFGTTTTLGADISAPVQNGAVPGFTLGYKRLEAVWMPLRPQGAPQVTTAGTAEVSLPLAESEATLDLKIDNSLIDNKYASLASGVSPEKGGSNLELDTYSVFASLGAKGGVGFNSASGHLAQFFATGIAAQRLGANETVGEALNATAPQAAAAKAEADKAKAEEVPKTVQALIDGGASPEDAAKLAGLTEERRTKADADTIKASGCVQAWNKTLPESLQDDQAKAIATAGYSDEDLAEELRANSSARAAILKSCTGS